MSESEETYAVEVRNLSKRFPSGEIYIDVLRGIDLVAKKGEMLMITGPSGSGKTTLLSIMAGTLHFDQGTVNIFGTNLKDMSDNQMTEFRKRHIGFIFQQFHLLKALSVLQNVSVPLLLNGMKENEALDRSAVMLSRVGLRGKENLKPSRLSGGEQQRVAIARALIHDPWLVICDEPTASLDADNGTKIMQILSEVSRSPDRCAIVVTHDNRIYKYANTIAAVEDGLIISYTKQEPSHSNKLGE